MLETDVEYYHVDYVALQKTYYSASGEVIKTPIDYEGLPTVAGEFNVEELRLQFSTASKMGSIIATLPSGL